MTAGFGATTEEMHRAATHVFAVNDAVQTELSTLRTRLTPLSAAWRGEAAAAFGALMSRWDLDARQLSAALHGIGEAVQGSGRSYQSQEEQYASALSAIRTALG